MSNLFVLLYVSLTRLALSVEAPLLDSSCYTLSEGWNHVELCHVES